MLTVLRVVCVLLVAATAGLALAHALELPGKLRLPPDTYRAVQAIYYPGFTIGGGISEAGGIVALVLLVVLTPAGTTAFLLTLGALFALLALHLVFWLVVQPVNRFWLKDVRLSRAGHRFFSFAPADGPGESSWTLLRDRWEAGHVVRAALGLVGLVLLTTAVMA